MPATATYSLTGNAHVDSLLGGVKWAVRDLTFSLPISASYYGSGYGNGETGSNFGVLNAAQQAAARATFDLYSSVANVTFTEIAETSTQHADIRLARSDAPSTAWAYFPTTAAEGGDMWFNNSNGYYDAPQKGNYAYTTFLHETGHSLGLEHSHEGNVMPENRDSMEYTVMSYRSYVGASTTSGYTNEQWGFAQSLMMYDIAALQHMYGANYGTNAGNTTYSWSQTTGEMSIDGVGQGAPGANRIFLTVWDGGGVDTYDFSNYGTNLQVDLRPGQWTTTSSVQLAKLHYNGSQVAVGNIANALLHNDDARSLIENAKGGSGNDTIIGNAAANTLWGNAGDDVLFGASAGDTMIGGEGSDTYHVDNAGDRLVEDNVPGVDRVFSSVSFSLREYSQFLDDLTLTGSNHVAGTGNGRNNTITGNEGNNVLNGAGGNDVLIGGAGNDTFRDDHGADRMEGGTGSDTYHVDDAGDRLVEDNVPGVDRVLSSVSFSLREHSQFLDDLTLTGSNHIAGTGNGRNNTITGNEGNNVLNGAAGNDVLIGGAGNDTFRDDRGADRMEGGTGSDTYYVDNAGDRLVEDNVPGVDRVFSSVSFSLREHSQFLDDLTLTGSNHVAGTGNGRNNRITGNEGNIVLNGAGGNDVLIGGAGNDTFRDDHGADRMEGGAGNDIFMFQKENESVPFARDTIVDFFSGTDKIHLSSIDANDAASGDQAFSFIGGGAFSGKAGELNFVNGVLSGDTNGDGIADFQVDILNVSVLVESDFYL